MQVANVKHSHCEAKFCRVWAKFGRVRRKTEPTGLGEKVELPIYFLKLHETEPTGLGSDGLFVFN